MKNFLPVLFLLFSSAAFAQKNEISVSFGPSFADPLNTSGTEYFKKGIGASLKAFYPVSKNGSIMANISYVSFGYKPKFTTSYSLTSFKLGYKTFVNNSRFYVYGDAGLVQLTVKDKSWTSSSRFNALGLGLGAGYSLPITKNSFIDFSPSLNYNNSQFGRKFTPDLNISYGINLFK